VTPNRNQKKLEREVGGHKSHQKVFTFRAHRFYHVQVGNVNFPELNVEPAVRSIKATLFQFLVEVIVVGERDEEVQPPTGSGSQRFTGTE